MYTITLANGKKLTGLDMNGTNYVSKEKVDETIFKDNLSTMKVSDGETETTYTDMVFIQQMEWADGTFYLAFREKTKEENRSWCSSSRENDQRAVTIECASDKTAPYAFNDAVYASLVNLCVDICQRNGKSKLLWLGDKNKTLTYAPKSDEMVLTVHRWFANKSCPGDWLYNRLGNLAAEVTKRLTGGSTDTGKVDVPSDSKTLYRVQTGAFSKRSNADAWAAKLKAAGFDTYIVQMGNLYKVQVGAYSQKSNAENMMAKLKAAGYDAFITTKSGTAAGTAKKSAAEIAKEIYNGTCSDARWSSWGNGADRVNRLKQADYDPSEVQSEVNKLF